MLSTHLLIEGLIVIEKGFIRELVSVQLSSLLIVTIIQFVLLIRMNLCWFIWTMCCCTRS